MYSIGEIISTYRKKKGLLQQDLADELAKEGITISYKAISNWERNLAEPSVTIFYKVCRILGITNMYEAYFGVNPTDPFSSLNDQGEDRGGQQAADDDPGHGDAGFGAGGHGEGHWGHADHHGDGGHEDRLEADAAGFDDGL